MRKDVDYIVVGAGSAGCVLAQKLSDTPKQMVTLLEAGHSDRDPLIHIPLGVGRIHPNRLHDWGYDVEPEPSLNGRVLTALRGKVVGGTSSINSMTYVRGNPGDYARWVEKGATGWGFSNVLPYFIANETWRGPSSETRGKTGLVVVEPSRDHDPLYGALLKSACQAGYRHVVDYNGEDQEGFSKIQFSIRDGRRCSAATAFLRPALTRKNLDLRTGVHVRRILFKQNRAIGVEYGQGGQTHQVFANREVILSGGAFNSPQLLMLSGIGPGAHLREHGIEVKVDLPGVGANLQDHLCALLTYKRNSPGHFRRSMRFDRMAFAMLQAYLLGTGPATLLPAGILGHIKTDPGLSAPDLQFIFRGVPTNLHMWFPGIKRAFEDGFGIRPVLLHPESRGHVRLRSSDPSDKVRISYNFLSDPRDIETLRRGMRIARDVMAGTDLSAFRGEELSPGPKVQSDDEIDAWMRENVTSANHPVGTCSMGNDRLAVLDEVMRVRGVDALRVVDASAMPDLTSGNTNAPIMMIAARAADLILGGDVSSMSTTRVKADAHSA